MKQPRHNFLRSFVCACKGFYYVFEERNFRIQLAIAFIVLVFAFVFPLTPFERIVVFFLCALVLGAEMLNSAFERFIDFHVKTHEIEIGKIKDIAAGAVLLFSFLALVVGLWIFVPYVFN